MRRYPSRDLIASVAALLVPPFVAAVLLPWRDSLPNTSVALVLVVVVVGVAALGNRVAGAVAALSAAVWFDFFFTRPYQEFAIAKAADVQTAVLLLVVGVAVSQLAAYARRMRVVTITSADYLKHIYQTAELAQTSAGAHAVVEHVRDQLVEILSLKSCRFEYGSLIGHPPQLRQDGTVMSGRRRWDVERLGLPTPEVELRVIGNGRYYGRYMLSPTPGNVPPLQARLVAVTLADQAGSALDASGGTLGD
ncbi:DUF4118 domain-containing protein [Nonomuraea sp. NPDC003560]|uniref:DUF4118 domain-containing protein n=1 Tax=Nonomuraea sp. NPDC003560 TaxID=3364341 RepID=UPI0036CEBE92